MAQNSSKSKASWEAVPFMMQALCIISVSSQSLRVSPSSLAILLKESKSATPFPWLSQIWKTLLSPSLDLVSPTLEQTISRNSSNLTGLFTYLRLLIISKTIALLPLRPSSSKIFSTSTGSIVPPLSSSNRSKVAFSSSQSWELSLSFQELEVLAAGAGALVPEAAVLLPFIQQDISYKQKLKFAGIQTLTKIVYQPFSQSKYYSGIKNRQMPIESANSLCPHLCYMLISLIFNWTKKMLRLSRTFCRYSLSKEQQAHRSSLFYGGSSAYPADSIHYHYNLALHPGSSYEGVAEIQFKLAKKGELFLDFRGKVKSVVVNGRQLEANAVHDQKQNKIRLQQGLVREGDNRVSVLYENQYDKEGSGCVSFTDVDTKQYLYTQFEPYEGNRVFPMFDQPDLKARMQLSIACPSEWEAVLSNQTQNLTTPQGFTLASPACQLASKVLQDFQASLPSTYKITQFPATKLLPTYLLCFVVGPYKKYVSQKTYRGIPMNLYCIESLYPYMMRLVPFIEEMTNQSMEFFEKYFGYPYPFNKYDQVFAHEYKWGAMENAGIVTLNDSYIFKDPVSNEKMISFGNTIIHEMAHHWFGNLVTMKWWDDLWLNESFAEYISHYCLEKIKGQVTTIAYESAMVSFLNRKGWGYMEDQLITTHPIRTDVANTLIAESIFDGITYSKGAATMKQLMYLMGEQAFSAALKEYFYAYQFKNAELADLLHFMEKHYRATAGVSIQQWREMWLEKAGLNIIEHELDKANSILRIKQSAYHQNHLTLRSHTIKVGLVIDPQHIDQLQVTVQAQPVTQVRLTPAELAKFTESKAILLNHEDLSFVKIIIDPVSLAYFKQNINKIEDVLLRSIVWKNVYSMVQDGQIKAREFVEMLANSIGEEKSDLLFEENLTNAIAAIQRYIPVSTRSTHNPDLSAATECRSLLYSKLPIRSKEAMQGNRGVIIRDRLIALSDSEPRLGHLGTLVDWMEGCQDTTKLLGQPNTTEKWKIVMKILQHRRDRARNQELLDRMITQDSSDVMQNKKLTCQNILLEGEEFLGQFRDLTQGEPRAWSRIKYIHALSGLNCRKHRPLLLQYNIVQEYFTILQEVLTNAQHGHKTLGTPELLEAFIDHMDPLVEDTVDELRAKKQRFESLVALPISNDKIKISIMKKIDLLAKRIKCYQLYN